MPPKKGPVGPIYNRVRVLRVERDLTRAQLAEAIDINISDDTYRRNHS